MVVASSTAIRRWAIEASFSGKVALVTGASRGLGRFLALALAKRGAIVVGTARTLDKESSAGESLRKTFAEIASAGGQGQALPTRITDPALAQDLVGRVESEYGHIDILVNNAGVFPEGKVDTFPVREWSEALGINITAPFLLTRCALPRMMQRRSGNIVNITSIVAQRYVAGRVVYSATKAAIDRFTINLAEEVREFGIAVNAYSPGLVSTDINGRRGQPVEIVEASALWVLSQDASTFTGQVVDRPDFGETWGPGISTPASIKRQ